MGEVLLRDIIERLGGELIGDPATPIRSIEPLEAAGPAATTACAPMLASSPTTAPAPITAKAPTSTRAPSRAAGSIAALAWIDGAGRDCVRSAHHWVRRAKYR